MPDVKLQIKWGTGERNEGNDGNGGIRLKMMGMQGIRVGMMGMRVRMWRIGAGIRGIRVGLWRTEGGNERNQGKNLRIRVEIMNKKCGEG